MPSRAPRKKVLLQKRKGCSEAFPCLWISRKDIKKTTTSRAPPRTKLLLRKRIGCSEVFPCLCVETMTSGALLRSWGSAERKDCSETFPDLCISRRTRNQKGKRWILVAFGNKCLAIPNVVSKCGYNQHVHICNYYQTHVYMGSDLWVLVSLSHWLGSLVWVDKWVGEPDYWLRHLVET